MKNNELKSIVITMLFFLVLLIVLFAFASKDTKNNESEYEEPTVVENEYVDGVYVVSNEDGTFLCETPEGEYVYTLVDNSHFMVYKVDDHYGAVVFKNMHGWVDLRDCEKVDDEGEYFGFEDSCGIDVWQVNTNHDPLNIRNAPSMDAKIIDRLEKGTIIEIIDYEGKWGYVECTIDDVCEMGWVNTEYCVPYISMSGWVYVTEYGKKYHTKDCWTIQDSENVYMWHRDQAEYELDACKVCGGW